MRNTRNAAKLVYTLLVLGVIGVPAVALGHPAVQMIDLVWKHLGGRENFEKCRYLEFTFTYESNGEVKSTRKHIWDRYTGDYVAEFKDRQTGDDLKVYFNVDTREGVALKNGSPVEEAENAKLVDRANKIFVNDSYWLLLPAKLSDPGVRAQYVGHEGKPIRNEKELEFVVLHIWFKEGIGLTPGDQYWVSLTHEGAVARWRYELEDGEKAEWIWKNERDCGMGVILPTRKESMDGSEAIVFPVVKFSASMDPAVFKPPVSN